MLDKEREELITDLLKQKAFVSLQEIISASGASAATVRRDLTRLEEQGVLQRIHGGAKSVMENLPLDMRQTVMLDEKTRIAKKAVGLCAEGETVFIDGGSTTSQMAAFLKMRRLEIVTNSLALTTALVESHNEVVLTGGSVLPKHGLVLNPFEDDLIDRYRASKAIMGIGGLDPVGPTNDDPRLIRFEQKMLALADEIILLADSSKFGKREKLLLCDYSKISTIITDKNLAAEHRKWLKKLPLKLIVV
jgi:DeoR family ulaG and ulaABCDEF operon transcriptional repressor